MPVIYYNIDEQKSLEKEPYKSLTKRFKNLKNALEEKEIELSIGTDKEGFSKILLDKNSSALCGI